MPIDLSPPEILERVIPLKSLAFQAGVIAGPIAAGFAAVAADELPYLMAMVLLALAAMALAFVPKPPIEQLETAPGPAQAFRDAVEGIAYIRRNPILRGAISLDLFAVLLGGATALLPAIASERLGVGEVGLGWLRAADGIGAALVSLALTYRPIRRRLGRALLSTVAVFGVAVIFLGLTTSYAVAFAAILVLSGADAISVYVRSSLVPVVTPEVMRGRVIAVENVFIGGSNELGALESGVAAQALGLVPAIVTGGIGTLLVVALWWRFFPELRDVDRFDDVRIDKLAPQPGAEL
ncbi:MAG: MFS transporter [Acidimicrobiales bacterium]|nr:MFS transporter [Acidimicrobiales bacterium]